VIVTQLLQFSAAATDTDLPPNNLTYSISGQQPGMTIDSSGVFAWRPAADQQLGTYNVTITVTDSGIPTLSDSETISIVVLNGVVVSEERFFEGDYAPNATIRILQPPTTTYSIQWATAAGSAAALLDYVEIDWQTLTFGPGLGSRTVPLQTRNDGTDEDDEHFYMLLQNPSSNLGVLWPQTQISIFDNDRLPTSEGAIDQPLNADNPDQLPETCNYG